MDRVESGEKRVAKRFTPCFSLLATRGLWVCCSGAVGGRPAAAGCGLRSRREGLEAPPGDLPLEDAMPLSRRPAIPPEGNGASAPIPAASLPPASVPHPTATATGSPARPEAPRLPTEAARAVPEPVSYTHLTLPTIYSV